MASVWQTTCKCDSASCIICFCLLVIDCVAAYQLLKDFPLILVLLGSVEVHSVLISMFLNDLRLLFYGTKSEKFSPS